MSTLDHFKTPLSPWPSVHIFYSIYKYKPNLSTTYNSSFPSISQKNRQRKSEHKESTDHRDTMKLVWSPETAIKAYIESVKKFKESGVAELLSAMAAGWNTKFIVECWSHGGPVATSVGLAVAACNTGARHLCIVPDEQARMEYTKAVSAMGVSPPSEVLVGEAETIVARLDGLDFLVVDCKRRDFARVLRVAKVSPRGAVLACKNAWERNASAFRWHAVLGRGTRVVRSVFLPVGKGLDIAYVGSRNGGANATRSPSRWIKHIDPRSGEEHIYREHFLR